MTRKIRLDQIDDVMKEAVQELVQKTTLQWTTLAKKATPVKTGNLRNGWKTNIQKKHRERPEKSREKLKTLRKAPEKSNADLFFHTILYCISCLRRLALLKTTEHVFLIVLVSNCPRF